jgi:hypothetical protein
MTDLNYMTEQCSGKLIGASKEQAKLGRREKELID